MNLLTNAVKFTAKGEVSMRAMRDDTFVFEPFRRSQRAGDYPGLGIGLAIARRQLEVHGGSIDASSDGPGRRATFTVLIPPAWWSGRLQPAADATLHYLISIFRRFSRRFGASNAMSSTPFSNDAFAVSGLIPSGSEIERKNLP